LLRDMTTQIAVQSTCIINNHVSSFYCSGAKTIGSGVGVAVGVSVGFGVSVGVKVKPPQSGRCWVCDHESGLSLTQIGQGEAWGLVRVGEVGWNPNRVSSRFRFASQIRMDCDTLDAHARWAHPLSGAGERRLACLKRHPHLADVTGLIGHVLRRGVELEQEAVRVGR
jgi:hypothetical protein